jgi:hypothetical protein
MKPNDNGLASKMLSRRLNIAREHGGYVKKFCSLVGSLVIAAGATAFAQNPPTPKDCDALAKKMKPGADKCLRVSDFNKRRECADKLGKNINVPESHWQGCRGVMDPMKAEYIAKEKAKYPKQASAFDDKGGGHDNMPGGPGNMPGGPGNMPGGPGNMPGGPGNMPGGPDNMAGGPGNMPPGGPQHMNGPAMSPEKCAKEIPSLKKKGENCLKVSKFEKRKSCFDEIEKKMPKGYFESCRPQIEPLKGELQAKEKAKYPKQASALDGGGGPNNGPGPNNAPGGSNTAGQPGSPGAQPQWPAEKCNAEVPKLRSQAENCLKVTKADARKQCFDKLGNSMPPGFFDSCRMIVEPIKGEMMAKEKAKYPTQASGLQDGPNNAPGGPQNTAGMPGPEMMDKNQKPNADCGKFISDVRNSGQKCIGMSNQGSRKKCFDEVGNGKIQKSGMEQACRDPLNQLKSEFQAMERQKYPNTEPSIN